jgi:hypothetical protein
VKRAKPVSKVPSDEDLISGRLGLSDGTPRDDPITQSHYLRVKTWLYRLGNSRSPDGWHTVISIYGSPEVGNAIGAYLSFLKQNNPIPPNYDEPNKMVHLSYSIDQIQPAISVLELIGRKGVFLFYREYESGHRWAELQHEPLP